MSRQYPEGRFRILGASSDGDAGVGLVEIHSTNLDELLEEMRSAADIIDVDVLNEPGKNALVQFETERPLVLFAARDSGVPLEMPVELSETLHRAESKIITEFVDGPDERADADGTVLQ